MLAHYAQVVCLAMAIVVTAEVPVLRHLCGHRVYIYQLKIALLVLREYLDLPYRRMYEMIDGNPIVTNVLGMTSSLTTPRWSSYRSVWT